MMAAGEGESVPLRDAIPGGVAHAPADVPTPTDILAALNGLSGLNKKTHEVWREREEEVKRSWKGGSGNTFAEHSVCTHEVLKQ